jgi:hypothetical protein
MHSLRAQAGDVRVRLRAPAWAPYGADQLASAAALRQRVWVHVADGALCVFGLRQSRTRQFLWANIGMRASELRNPDAMHVTRWIFVLVGSMRWVNSGVRQREAQLETVALGAGRP